MCTYHLSVRGSKLPAEGARTKTVLVKKPEDREILELVDVERTNPGVQSSECTAPAGYRCPYRRYRTSPRRAVRVEMLSTDIMPKRKGEDRGSVELVDLDSMYTEARCSECTAPPSYRCAYRQYSASLPAAHIGVLSQSESGLSHSQPLRLTLNGNRPGSGKRTEDFCPLTYSENFSKPSDLVTPKGENRRPCENLTTCSQLSVGEKVGNKDREVYGGAFPRRVEAIVQEDSCGSRRV